MVLSLRWASSCRAWGRSPQPGGAGFTLSAVLDAVSILGAVALAACFSPEPATCSVGFTSKQNHQVFIVYADAFIIIIIIIIFNLSLSKSSLLNAPNLATSCALRELSQL